MTSTALGAPAPTHVLPDFDPVFTQEQVFQLEDEYNTTWGEKRRLVMIALARTPAQLAEGFANIEPEAFSYLLDCFDDFKNHCKAGMELADCATARLLAVGMYIANLHEGDEA